jgi:TolB protein
MDHILHRCSGLVSVLFVLVLITFCLTSTSYGKGSTVTVNAAHDGSEKNITQVTTQKKEDVWPAVSPDGAKVAFMSRQKPVAGGVPINYDIWTVDASSNRVFTQITNHPAHECYPAWSPDSKKIYFDSPRINDVSSIWRVNVAGTGAATQVTSRDVHDFTPNVSPDGKKIAFTSRERYDVLVEQRAGEPWIYFKMDMPYIWVANADGSELTQLVEGVGPIWSPDSQKLVFYSNVTGNWDIWLMNADGSELTQLTSGNKSDEVTPAWSPDGQKIVFSSNKSGNFDIWMMNVDTSELTQLTYNKKDDCGPVWNPDGKHIYFHSNRAGNWDIWRVTVDIEPETEQQ